MTGVQYNALVVVVFSKVKVVVVTIHNQPHLVCVAKVAIDVGDELLLDYNDKQSGCSFLKTCPVCGTGPAAATAQPSTSKVNCCLLSKDL